MLAVLNPQKSVILYTTSFQTIKEYIKHPKKQELLFRKINVSSLHLVHHTSHYTSWIICLHYCIFVYAFPSFLNERYNDGVNNSDFKKQLF